MGKGTPVQQAVTSGLDGNPEQLMRSKQVVHPLKG